MSWILGSHSGMHTGPHNLDSRDLRCPHQFEALLRRYSRHGRTEVQVAPTWTDDRGNGSALNKLMSTRFHRARSLWNFRAAQGCVCKGNRGMGSQIRELRSGRSRHRDHLKFRAVSNNSFGGRSHSLGCAPICRTQHKPDGLEHLQHVLETSDAASWKIDCESRIPGELSQVGLLCRSSAVW